MRDSRSKLYRAFAFYSMAIAYWGILSGLHTTVHSFKLALFLARVQHIGVILIPIFFTRFILILTNRMEKNKSWLYSTYFISPILLILLPNPLFVNRVVPEPPLHQVLRVGPLYILMILFFYMYISRGLLFLYSTYRKSHVDQKRKLGYLFWSSVLGYLGAPLTFLYCYEIPHPIILVYAIYTVPIYTIITTYAIIKHHLLDINIVFKRSLVYSLLVTSLTLIYLIIVWFLERTFQTAIGYRSLPATVFALSTIVFLFQPLYNRIQRFVDFNFFKGTLESLTKEKRRLEEEVRRTDQLRIAATLASGIAHEIKNPITSIKTFTKYLSQRKNEDGFIEKFQQVVENELGRIENLAKNLLDFARLKSPEFKKIDVHHILNQTLNLIARNLSVKNIFLRYENKDNKSETSP